MTSQPITAEEIVDGLANVDGDDGDMIIDDLSQCWYTPEAMMKAVHQARKDFIPLSEHEKIVEHLKENIMIRNAVDASFLYKKLQALIDKYEKGCGEENTSKDGYYECENDDLCIECKAKISALKEAMNGN